MYIFFRQWSKKYPICVILNEGEKIQVIEKESGLLEKKQSDSQSEKKSNVEDSIDNTSPEKKKKFIWKKKEKRYFIYTLIKKIYP